MDCIKTFHLIHLKEAIEKEQMQLAREKGKGWGQSYESSSSIYLQLIEEVDFYLILLYHRNRVRTLPLYLIDVIGLLLQ